MSLLKLIVLGDVFDIIDDHILAARASQTVIQRVRFRAGSARRNEEYLCSVRKSRLDGGVLCLNIVLFKKKEDFQSVRWPFKPRERLCELVHQTRLLISGDHNRVDWQRCRSCRGGLGLIRGEPDRRADEDQKQAPGD